MTLEQSFYEVRPYLLAAVGLWALAQKTSNIYMISGLLFLAAAAFIGYFRMYYRTNNASVSKQRQRSKVPRAAIRDEFDLYRKAKY